MGSRSELIDWNQNVREIRHHDPVEGTFTYELQEDVEPLIQMAKDMSYLQPAKDVRHAAKIPAFVLEKSMRERWDKKDWKKWANDPANKPFRTWPGKL